VFSSPTGEPVMAAVIMKWSKDIAEVPMQWKLGIDITKNHADATTESNFFDNNYSPKKVFQEVHNVLSMVKSYHVLWFV
jgi:hypothetical protein